MSCSSFLFLWQIYLLPKTQNSWTTYLIQTYYNLWCPVLAVTLILTPCDAKFLREKVLQMSDVCHFAGTNFWDRERSRVQLESTFSVLFHFVRQVEQHTWRDIKHGNWISITLLESHLVLVWLIVPAIVSKNYSATWYTPHELGSQWTRRFE